MRNVVQRSSRYIKRIPGAAHLRRHITLNQRLLTDWFALTLGLLAITCWLLLLRWYSLLEHYATPGFAFDKIPGHLDSPTLRYTTLLFVALSTTYIAGYWVIHTASRISPHLKLAITAMSVGGGLVSIFIYPMGAIDLFYYIAQIKIAFGYHANPYLVTFVPSFADDPLAKLGWPLHIPPAYGPAWLLIEGLPATIVGFDRPVPLLLTYKAFNFVLVIMCGLLISMHHTDNKRKWQTAYAFTANPVIIFEAVANGHNDILMTTLLIAAILAFHRRSWLALPLLALSALVKVFAVVLIPVFLVAAIRWKWRWDLLIISGLTGCAVAVGVIAPWWADGHMLRGMLQGMSFAHDLSTLSLFSLFREYLQQEQFSSAAIATMRLGFAGLFSAFMLLVLWCFHSLERALVLVLLLFFTLVSSLHPWYLIPVFALLTITNGESGSAYLFCASGLSLLCYPFDVWTRFGSGLPNFQQHIVLSMLLTLPILALLGYEFYRMQPFKQEARGMSRTHGQLML